MGPNVSSRPVGDVQRVLDGVRRIVQGLHESSRETQRRTGLTAAQLFVLSHVAEDDGLSINDLASKTFTHQSSVSVVASRLVARRLLARRTDPDDRRRRRLTLTRAGQHALAAAPVSAQKRLITAIGGLSPSARRTVGRALETFADAMVVDRRPVMFFEARGRS